MYAGRKVAVFEWHACMQNKDPHRFMVSTLQAFSQIIMWVALGAQTLTQISQHVLYQMQYRSRQPADSQQARALDGRRVKLGAAHHLIHNVLVGTRHLHTAI